MTAPRTSTRILARAVAVISVIAALTGAVFFLFIKGPTYFLTAAKNETIDAANKVYDLGKRVGGDIGDALQIRPKVTVAGTTVVEASKTIAELSTVEKRFEHTHSWTSTWLGSTKRIKLRGVFVAKAGYDLTKPFSLEFSEDGQTIRATMPPAKLNSVEQLKVEVVEDQNGIWNRISAAERQQAMNALLVDAKKSLESTSLLSDADKALLHQLEGIVKKSAPTSVIVREGSVE